MYICVMQNASFDPDANKLTLRFLKVNESLQPENWKVVHYIEERGAWDLVFRTKSLHMITFWLTLLSTGQRKSLNHSPMTGDLPDVIQVWIVPHVGEQYVPNPARSFEGAFSWNLSGNLQAQLLARPISRIFSKSNAFSPYIPTLCDVNDVCPICTFRGKISDKWVRLPCHRYHIFHYKCAAKLREAKCPLCREPFNNADVRVCDSENHQVQFGQNITKVGNTVGMHRYNAQTNTQAGGSRRVGPVSPRAKPKPKSKPKPKPKPKASPRASPRAKPKVKTSRRAKRASS